MHAIGHLHTADLFENEHEAVNRMVYQHGTNIESILQEPFDTTPVQSNISSVLDQRVKCGRECLVAMISSNTISLPKLCIFKSRRSFFRKEGGCKLQLILPTHMCERLVRAPSSVGRVPVSWFIEKDLCDAHITPTLKKLKHRIFQNPRAPCKNVYLKRRKLG